MSGAAITLAVDFYYSFRSPYSYLAVARMVRLAADHDVEVRLRAVYPLAIRRPELVERNIRLGRGDGGVGADVAFSPYIVRDAPRLAEFHGIPFAWPRPDPIVMQRDPFRVAAEQPNIRRVTRLAIEAEHRGQGLAFADEVSGIIFSGRVDGWDTGTYLAEAMVRAGLDAASMEEAVAANAGGLDAAAEENATALAAAGHWGVPTMVFEGEPFFGQDRIEVLIWRMKSRGLESTRWKKR
ncbi:MAG TPA: DsbA family protein [Rhodospirillales bacterium]|jgi:2-hydroxychromene-2-carboxylate isomerase|nr:DsbA family protein [Rhodospirillales bacterium]HJO68399.1 DsbA family protein [Rhodospirillales bacterium]